MSEGAIVKPEVAAFIERIRANRPKLQRIELKCLGVVYLRKPTGADQEKIATIRTELSAQKIARLPQSIFAAVMGSVLLLQEDGTPYFQDAQVGFNELREMGGAELDELYHAIMKACELEPKAIENAEKKSSGDQSSDSGSN